MYGATTFIGQGEYRDCVCKIKKALYVRKFSKIVMGFCLHRYQVHHLVFHLHTDTKYILVIYEEGILIPVNNSRHIVRLKQFLE